MRPTLPTWLLLGLCALFLIAGPGRAAAATRSAADCAALAGTGFAGVQDAATSVMSATYVEAKAGRPAYCDVEGYVSPNAGFALWLPADWNGKFIARGCGGFCGVTAGEFACKDPLALGYACLQTDMGHKSGLTDGAWGYRNLEAKAAFGWRATHATTLAAKAILARWYGGPARRNYFVGCSTGGRQALVEAQRFPGDFDGVVSIAPAMNETGGSVALTWALLANRLDGHNILPASKLAMLHAAVVDACDLGDGLKDGLIGDLRQCRFHPETLTCRGADAPTCLTAAQVAVVQRIYAGPTNSKGGRLFPGGAPMGSEGHWSPGYIGVDDAPGASARIVTDFWRYLGFPDDPGPAWTLEQFDFDRDPPRTGDMETFYGGSNPDLRGFKAAGGKLLLVQGLSDEVVPPGQAIDYAEGVTRFMGGPAATADFFRFFPVPGMNHCTAGEGAWAIDYLAVLEAWSEKGSAPDVLMGAHPADKVEVPYLGVGLRLAPEQTAFRRPMFPWPATARYRGRGDPAAAGSWDVR